MDLAEMRKSAGSGGLSVQKGLGGASEGKTGATSKARPGLAPGWPSRGYEGPQVESWTKGTWPDPKVA